MKNFSVYNHSIGVSLSGPEYAYGTTQSNTDLDYVKANNLRFVRQPICWEKLQPKLGKPLDPTYLALIVDLVARSWARGMPVVLDVHNYGRWNPKFDPPQGKPTGTYNHENGDSTDSHVLGSGKLPLAKFYDLWTRLATAFVGNPGVIGYGLMNEPHDMPNASTWPTAAQGAVNVIRAIDTDTPIMVAGDEWSSAADWQFVNASLNITDPSNKIYYEAHVYFDPDGSGSYTQSYDGSGATPTTGVAKIQPFLDWLAEHSFKGFIGEFAVPSTDERWLVTMQNVIVAAQAANLPLAYWYYAVDMGHHGVPFWWMGYNDGSDAQAFNLALNNDDRINDNCGPTQGEQNMPQTPVLAALSAVP